MTETGDGAWYVAKISIAAQRAEVHDELCVTTSAWVDLACAQRQ